MTQHPTVLSFGMLERALVTALRVDPERTDTFRARLKQLQRLGFPPGVNVGRGTKMSYSTEHLLQLMFAFELISTGLPAKTATEMVLQGWQRIRSACSVLGRYDPFIGEKSPEMFVVWRPDLLGQQPSAVLPRVEDLNSISNSFGPASSPGTHILVEASRLVSRLVDVGGEASRISTSALYREMSRWAKPPEFDWSQDEDTNWFRVGAFDEKGVLR
jgi:hypothetical protein